MARLITRHPRVIIARLIARQACLQRLITRPITRLLTPDYAPSDYAPDYEPSDYAPGTRQAFPQLLDSRVADTPAGQNRRPLRRRRRRPYPIITWSNRHRRHL